MLTTKADRVNIFEVQKWTETEFISRKDHSLSENEFEKTIKRIESASKALSDRVEVVETNIASVVSSLVDQEMALRMQKYERVANSFQQYFQEGTITNILNAKIEQRELDLVANSKIDRTELDPFCDKLESLERKLRQMAVLQVELSRQIVPQPVSKSEMENHQAQRMNTEMLLRYSKILHNWVQGNK